MSVRAFRNLKQLAFSTSSNTHNALGRPGMVCARSPAQRAAKCKRPRAARCRVDIVASSRNRCGRMAGVVAVGAGCHRGSRRGAPRYCPTHSGSRLREKAEGPQFVSAASSGNAARRQAFLRAEGWCVPHHQAGGGAYMGSKKQTRKTRPCTANARGLHTTHARRRAEFLGDVSFCGVGDVVR